MAFKRCPFNNFHACEEEPCAIYDASERCCVVKRLGSYAREIIIELCKIKRKMEDTHETD